MALLTALLDANILYPAGLRDVLLRLADQYLYAPLWSADIHAEWIRSVLADRPDLTEGMLERTRMVMDRHFPEAVVTGYTARAAGLDLPDPDDLHVLAAAIEGGAEPVLVRAGESTKSKGAGSIPAKTSLPFGMAEPLTWTLFTRPPPMLSLPSQTMFKVDARFRTSTGVCRP